MEEEIIRYDKWIEDSLRNVIKRALAVAAGEGLPGEHHFYITFNTGADGVTIPERLKPQHPDEMTIVIQHQYEDILVGDDDFEVTLYFGGRAGHLRIPFEAVTAFSDPSVNFALQFKGESENENENAGEDNKKSAAVEAFPEQDTEAGASAGGANKETGEVIALDSFRKE